MACMLIHRKASGYFENSVHFMFNANNVLACLNKTVDPKYSLAVAVEIFFSVLCISPMNRTFVTL